MYPSLKHRPETEWPTPSERVENCDKHRAKARVGTAKFLQGSLKIGTVVKPFVENQAADFVAWFQEVVANVPPSVLVDDRDQRLARLEKLTQTQQIRLTSLEKAVTDMIVGPPVKLGAFEEWRNSAASESYAGLHVAFMEKSKEVVAAEETLGALLKSRKKVDPEKRSVVGLVPG